MRSAVIIACLIILAGLGGGVAWGWVESRGAAPAVAAAKPARGSPADALAKVEAIGKEAGTIASSEAAREVTSAMTHATTSPMEFQRKMKVPYNVASQIMIGKAMNVNKTLERSWDGDSVLRLTMTSLTNQKTTSVIAENGKPVMTTTVWVESAEQGAASVLHMKVNHDPDAMARLLTLSHPRKGAQDVGPKISTFAVKSAMSLVASQSTREMDKAYAHVLKTPDKRDDLQAAAYNNRPGVATAVLYAMADGVFPETRGRRAPAPGW